LQSITVKGYKASLVLERWNAATLGRMTDF